MVDLYQRGQLRQALDLAVKGLRGRPNDSALLNVAGAAAQGLGLLAEAEHYWRAAIKVQPGFVNAHYNLGNLLKAGGRLEEAEAAYRYAIRLHPSYADAYNNLGNLLRNCGRLDEAEAAYRQALVAQPQFAEAYNNFGALQQRRGCLDDAESAYRQALVIHPGFAQALYNLGSVASQRGQLAQALAAFRQAIDIKPNYPEAISQLLDHNRQACDWRALAEQTAQVRAFAQAQVGEISPFTFLTLPTSPAEQLACASHWVSRRVAINARAALAPLSPRRHTTIRLGYLSADFHEHATAYLMAELFERHDRRDFKIIGYSCGPDDASPTRRRLMRAFDRFVDLQPLGDAEAARLIRDDEVDILVDLKGHTKDSRPTILAYRPAPVQVNYLGYPGTMGAPFVDYLIADAFVAPFAHQPFYSEALVHLPACYQPNDSQRAIAERTPTRTECGLPEQGFVFCCFNNSYKITPEFFYIWMRLLALTPGSVLWLLDTAALARDNLRREASACGVDPARLVFAPRLPLAEHLARHRLADLFLDTLPVNAHTTASDALWAALPVLTCAGESFAGRVAGSLLRAVGLPELITESPQVYEVLALRLAHQPELLASLRAKLQANRSNTPLFDSTQLARHLEIAYRRMWERCCTGDGPTAFAVAGDAWSGVSPSELLAEAEQDESYWLYRL